MALCPLPQPLFDTVFHAAPGFWDVLLDELSFRRVSVHGVAPPLVFCESGGRPAAWACNTWIAPHIVEIESIGEAARSLRALMRNWHAVAIGYHRRTQLIVDRLPRVSGRALSFPNLPPSAPLGGWTLWDRHTLLAAPRTTSAFAGGSPAFVENRNDPPNRAYLKLFEALTLARRWPQPGSRCLDLGAAPGGWSWVLAELGAEVTAIDRAVLSPALAARPAISARRGDVFKVRVDDVPVPDWIVSDVVAYPERVLELARYWAGACPKAAVIMTVKFKGRADPALIGEFMRIAGSRITHLAANKNELTWFRLPDGGPIEASRFDVNT